MEKFNFLSGDEFRKSLEADYHELSLCMDAGAWKSVYVLAGSIIEAILTDYLVSIDYHKKASVDPLKLDLAQAISACKKECVLSDKSEQLSSAIKSYRNLIHPGRKIRLSENVDKNGAIVASALVDIIIKEISTTRMKNYGYTAEQIISKIESDPSAISIIGHIIKDINKYELENLLLRVIPERYISLTNSDCPSEIVLASLGNCFHSAFKSASKDIRKKVARKYIAILKEESEGIVFTYENKLFRIEYFKYFSKSEKKIAKEHILSRLEKEEKEKYADLSLLSSIKGIGEYLEINEISNFVDSLSVIFVYTEIENLKDTAKKCLTTEYSNMKENVQDKMIKRIDDWIKYLKDNQNNPAAKEMQEIKDYCKPIPF
ncbi:MAG: hypothetical protein PHE88_02810 [Elusimicrobia bacterium]|nr:hypothetical protein [Elusimicrobiota bacterium]